MTPIIVIKEKKTYQETTNKELNQTKEIGPPPTQVVKIQKVPNHLLETKNDITTAPRRIL